MLSTDIPALQRPRPGDLYLDHVAHFVPDLDAAAAVLQALGFCLTPEFAQTTRAADGLPLPAGTRVCSAMLAEGYFELIQPVADTDRTRRMRERMAGRAGIHLVSFGTPAAAGEYARLQRHGFAPLRLAHHERPVPCASGDLTAGMLRARYQAVHVPHRVMPEGRIEYIEHDTPEVLWQERWVQGMNARCALRLLLLRTCDIAATAGRWAHFSGALPEPAANGARLRLARGQVLIRIADDAPPDAGANEENAVIAACGLALEAPQQLLDALERLNCAPFPLGPGVWRVALPEALGGCWLIGRRAALDCLYDAG